MKMTISKKKLEHVIEVIEKVSKSSPEVKSLIKLNGDGFSVNWKKVAELRCRAGNQLNEFASDILLDLEKLSLESKNNYVLVQKGRHMNPYCVCETYFKKKEDALAYKKALISGFS